VKLRIKAIVQKALTFDYIAKLIIEFVERYCSQNANVQKCAVALPVIKDGLKVIAFDAVTGDLQLSVASDSATDSSSSSGKSRRQVLDSSSDSATIVSNAAQDPASNQGYTVDTNTGSNTGATSNTGMSNTGMSNTGTAMNGDTNTMGTSNGAGQLMASVALLVAAAFM